MPTLTAANFNLINATPTNITDFNQAISYLQQSTTGAAIIAQAAASNIAISFNRVGRDEFNTVTGIAWDSHAALTANDGHGNVLGVQSPALGLVHELVHSIDPAVIANFAQSNPQTGNVAIAYENMVAAEVGEPQRVDHSGIIIGTE